MQGGRPLRNLQKVLGIIHIFFAINFSFENPAYESSYPHNLSWLAMNYQWFKISVEVLPQDTLITLHHRNTFPLMNI